MNRRNDEVTRLAQPTSNQGPGVVLIFSAGREEVLAGTQPAKAVRRHRRKLGHLRKLAAQCVRFTRQLHEVTRHRFAVLCGFERALVSPASFTRKPTELGREKFLSLVVVVELRGLLSTPVGQLRTPNHEVHVRPA